MRRALKVAIFVVIIVVTVVTSCVYMYLQPPPVIEGGKDPVFSVTLVDNGENDYIHLKYVSAGTGFVFTPEVFRLEDIGIKLAPMENLYKYSRVRLPPGEWRVGENIRVFFNANVLETGKFYQVCILWYAPGENVYATIDVMQDVRCG